MTHPVSQKSRSWREPFDQARLQVLQELLCGRLDELFDHLGLGLHRSHKMYYGCCPVHGGDNQQALNLYHGGDVPGKWRCHTRHCEEIFRRTVIGFVRGVLSHQQYDWTGPESRSVSFNDAVDWCCKFVGKRFKDITPDDGGHEKRQFANSVLALTRKPQEGKRWLTKEDVRQWLQVPAEYFVKRGWSPEVLNHYDVGLYPIPDKPLSDRVAVPVYDNDGRFVVGFTGRSVFPQCTLCKRWHRPGVSCPSTQEEKDRACKWHNHSLRKESCLYNYWFARKHIAASGVAVLCEGPGEVWRLKEAGINVGLAALGTDLSDQQQILLETSGAMSLVVVTNMDTAGREASERLKQRLSRCYRLYFPILPANDLGDMTFQDVRSLLVPTLEQIRKSF